MLQEVCDTGKTEPNQGTSRTLRITCLLCIVQISVCDLRLFGPRPSIQMSQIPEQSEELGYAHGIRELHRFRCVSELRTSLSHVVPWNFLNDRRVPLLHDVEHFGTGVGLHHHIPHGEVRQSARPKQSATGGVFQYASIRCRHRPQHTFDGQDYFRFLDDRRDSELVHILRVPVQHLRILRPGVRVHILPAVPTTDTNGIERDKRGRRIEMFPALLGSYHKAETPDSLHVENGERSIQKIRDGEICEHFLWRDHAGGPVDL